MPVAPTYPGVYVEEIPSSVRTIVGVSTSNTAFVDFFPRGPMNEAVRVTSFDDFTRRFGGLDTRSEASYAIQQYYLNGGQIAWVIRVAADDTALPSRLVLRSGYTNQETLVVTAANEGLWGNNLQVAVDQTRTREPNQFNLVVREVALVRGQRRVVASEIHRNLSMDSDHPRYAVAVVNGSSDLLRLEDTGIGELPAPTGPDVTDPSIVASARCSPQDASENGAVLPCAPTASPFLSLNDVLDPDPTHRASDGNAPDAPAVIAGIQALDRIEPFVFNLLCLPVAAKLQPTGFAAVVSAATTFCESKRAFFIVDIPEPPEIADEADMRTWMLANDGLRHENAAVYFPRLLVPDARNENRLRSVGPSGTLAGIYARTDATRGVWKAPAGTDADLRGATLPVRLTDDENGGLNVQGINALRTFPIHGNVAWGARTLDGADQAASEWKYIPIRRTALYIEESLYQGLKWVVFEPNAEPLWAQIRLNVGAFMQNLFRQGAFAGTTPRAAYLVRCDAETTTQNDVDLGIVNVLVGFAPLKPAEFVFIKIQQLAGQVLA